MGYGGGLHGEAVYRRGISDGCARVERLGQFSSADAQRIIAYSANGRAAGQWPCEDVPPGTIAPHMLRG